MGTFERQRNKYKSSFATRARFSFVLNLTGCIILFYLKGEIRVKGSGAQRVKFQRLHLLGYPKNMISKTPCTH